MYIGIYSFLLHYILSIICKIFKSNILIYVSRIYVLTSKLYL